MLEQAGSQGNELSAAFAGDWQPRNVHIRITKGRIKEGGGARDDTEGTIAVAIGAVVGEISIQGAPVESHASLGARDDAHARSADGFVERQRFGKTVVITATATRARPVEQPVAFGQSIAPVLGDRGVID